MIYPKIEKKKVIKTMKKAVRTRWLSLDAAVDALHKEYVGITQTLRIMKEDHSTNGAMADGLLKKIENPRFVGTLYMLKFVLPHLTTLSKTFQKGSLNFSRISPSIEKTIRKLHQITAEKQHLNSLLNDVDGRLRRCQFDFSTFQKEMIAELATRYINALENNIRQRFPKDVVTVLEAFNIFNAEVIPNSTSDEFAIYGTDEIEVSKKHYYDNKLKTGELLINQWEDFRYELVSLKKKWVSFKENLKANKLPCKTNATEWSLNQIVRCFSGLDDYTEIVSLAQIALTVPVTNAWPERGASAVKRVKSRTRSTMKNDLLNALLNISINGHACNSVEAKKLIADNVIKFDSRKRQKNPSSYRSIVKSISTSTQVEESNNLDIIDQEPAELLEIKDSLHITTNIFATDSDSEGESDNDESY